MTPSSRSGWPEGMARIAELIGEAATLKLIADHGGTKVYVATSPTPNTMLARSIGLRAARVLAKHYGTETLDLPNGAMLRSKKLAIAKAKGSQRIVALETRATERYVRMVRNGSQHADPRQGSLFKRDSD